MKESKKSMKFLLLIFCCYILSDLEAAPYIVPKKTGQIDSLRAASDAAYAGIEAQNNRMKVISQNIANSEVTGSTPGGDPYRRKVIFFKEIIDPKTGARLVKIKEIKEENSDFILKYQPNHPAADELGYVKYPNVNVQIELADGQEAKRGVSVNASSMDMVKSMQFTLLDLMKH